MRTWIKICGTTCLEDAVESIAAGADALGFIFAESKRRITPEQAEAIIRELPPGVEKIGVFLDAGAQEISRVVSQVDLTGIQMHGGQDHPHEVYRHLPAERRDSLRKIKTVLVRDGFAHQLQTLRSYADVSSMVNTWLFDSGAGSGRTFDWQAAREQLGDWQSQFVVAGGLTPENVGEAIRMFHPWGVDVVSGVERGPGRKDPEKLKAFAAAVRRTET